MYSLNNESIHIHHTGHMIAQLNYFLGAEISFRQIFPSSEPELEALNKYISDVLEVCLFFYFFGWGRNFLCREDGPLAVPMHLL